MYITLTILGWTLFVCALVYIKILKNSNNALLAQKDKARNGKGMLFQEQLDKIKTLEETIAAYQHNSQEYLKREFNLKQTKHGSRIDKYLDKQYGATA